MITRKFTKNQRVRVNFRDGHSTNGVPDRYNGQIGVVTAIGSTSYTVLFEDAHQWYVRDYDLVPMIGQSVPKELF